MCLYRAVQPKHGSITVEEAKMASEATVTRMHYPEGTVLFKFNVHVYQHYVDTMTTLVDRLLRLPLIYQPWHTQVMGS